MKTILKNIAIIIGLIFLSMLAFNAGATAKIPVPDDVQAECDSIVEFFSYAHTSAILEFSIKEAYKKSEVDYPNDQDYIREAIFLVYDTEFKTQNDRAVHVIGIGEVCITKTLMRNGLQPRQYDY